MIRQALILVGGLGTRLGELTQSAPKPLLRVGEKPFLAWLADELRRHDVDEILLLAGYRGEQVIEAARAFIPEARVLVESEPLGTGGALRFAGEALDERFFLLNGDSVFDVNLWDLAGLAEPGVAGALALRAVPDAARYGTVDLDGDVITRFRPRPEQPGPGLISGGVAVLSREVLNLIPGGRAVSIEQEVYQELARQGRLRGRVYERPFIDIGIPDDFDKAQSYVPAMMRRGAVVFDRDGVLNADVGYAHRPDQIAWVDGAVEAVKAVNDAGLLALVCTNQAGVARGYYGEEDVAVLHGWMNEQLKAHGAHIDAFDYSPFHPEGSVARYRAQTDCRKPGSGMLLRLFDRFRPDLSRTVMVGDKPIDVAAAEGAGVEGLLFQGGSLSAFLAPVLDRLRS